MDMCPLLSTAPVRVKAAESLSSETSLPPMRPAAPATITLIMSEPRKTLGLRHKGDGIERGSFSLRLTPHVKSTRSPSAHARVSHGSPSRADTVVDEVRHRSSPSSPEPL